jgi:hypothetical protein
MSHLPFIAGSYALALIVPLWLGIGAWSRLARARKRLAAIDTRARP